MNRPANRQRRSLMKGYVTILDDVTLESWIEKLKKSASFAFDTETGSLDNIAANTVGPSRLLSEHGVAAYVPVAHDCLDARIKSPASVLARLLKPLLEDEKLRKVGQNLRKYDRGVLQNYGDELRGIAFITVSGSLHCGRRRTP